MPIRSFLFLTLAFILILAACSQPEIPPAGGDASARGAETEKASAERDSLAGKLASLAQVKTEWSMGETKSLLTGYYEGDSLRAMEEQMTMGNFGDARSRYFYTSDGTLFAYDEVKNVKSGTNTENVKTEKVELALLFGQNGTLLLGQRRVDGQTAPLIGIEEQGVRIHARELEAALAEKRSDSK